MTAAITVRDYSWRYLHAASEALTQVTLTIDEGVFLGVIGPNGSGKTTLAYSLNGLIPGQYRGIKAGSVHVYDREVETYGHGELQRTIGVVFSDPEAQFTAMTVEDELVFGLENLGLSLAEIRERLQWVVDLVNLGPLLNKPPYEISGGQKQRVALAAVLAMKPRILVLDEPTSMLDPISRRRVFDVLNDLKQARSNTVIVIEHSLENLVPLADRMALLSGGSLVLEDETQAFFKQMDTLLGHGITPPGALRYFHALQQSGVDGGAPPLTLDAAATRLRALLGGQTERRS